MKNYKQSITAGIVIITLWFIVIFIHPSIYNIPIGAVIGFFVGMVIMSPILKTDQTDRPFNLYYDKKGKIIGLSEWGRLLSDSKYKIIEQTTLKNGKQVSTIWLGLDHSFGKGRPLIFETMVFLTVGNYNDIFCERYHTLRQAKSGHKKVVKEFSK